MASDTPDFTAQMQAHVAKELADAHNDSERKGLLIERLINSLALVIAVTAGGDPKHMSELLSGAEAYLNEAAAGHATLGAFMATAHRARAR